MSELSLREMSFELDRSGIYLPTTHEPVAQRGLYVPKEIDYDELAERFREGNDSYRVVTDPYGIDHELIVFNQGSAENGRVFKPSTSFSGVTKNPANVLETALLAATNPDKTIVFWSSFGNYRTGHMPRRDRRHVFRTGRMTQGYGTPEEPYAPLDSFRGLACVLEDEDLLPDGIIADQEAGRYALGLATALDENSLQGIYLNGIDGVSPDKSYIVAPFMEDMKSRVRRRQIDDQSPGELTPANIKDMKAQMPRIYSGIGKVAHLAPLPVFLFPNDVRDKINFTLGTKGRTNLDFPAEHAVFQDVMSGLNRHRARVVMQFNSASTQHDFEDCIDFSWTAMNDIPWYLRHPDREIRLWLGEGNWTQNTDSPYQGARLVRQAMKDMGDNIAYLVPLPALNPLEVVFGGLRKVA